MLTTPDRFQTAGQLARVWRNECLRVLYDRLIDAQDRKFIDEKLLSLINDQPTLKSHTELIFRQPSLFGDYRTALDMGEARIYEDLQDYEATKSIFDEVKTNHFRKDFHHIEKFLSFRSLRNTMNSILV